jgi:UDP-3-O-[3-hydroxymyristoyl] glucosamine N-acyltransferase
MRLDELARRIGGEVTGTPGVDVTRVASPGDPGPGAVVVVLDPRRLDAAEAQAAAVIVPDDAPPSRLPAIRVRNIRLALALALRALAPRPAPSPGIHPTCLLGAGVRLGNAVSLGPYVVIGDNAALGDWVQVHAHSVVEHDVRIGSESVLHPHVTVRYGCVLGARVVLQAGAVIGGDGFGYAQDAERRHIPIPQVGIVVLGDDVEIGANSTVDRATLGVTRIGRGTKLYNLVHIGHNVEIGEDVAIAAGFFVAGSVKIGNRVLCGGYSAIADHLTVGDDAIVLGGTGVTRDVPPRTVVAGNPARPRMEQRRAEAAAHRVPEMVRRLRELERRVRQLEGR